jgi:hypothetical protein
MAFEFQECHKQGMGEFVIESYHTSSLITCIVLLPANWGLNSTTLNTLLKIIFSGCVLFHGVSILPLIKLIPF